jgi:hypothetical protein
MKLGNPTTDPAKPQAFIKLPLQLMPRPGFYNIGFQCRCSYPRAK